MDWTYNNYVLLKFIYYQTYIAHLFSSSWTLKRSGLAYLNSQTRLGFGPTLGLRYPGGEAQSTLSLYHACRIFYGDKRYEGYKLIAFLNRYWSWAASGVQSGLRATSSVIQTSDWFFIGRKAFGWPGFSFSRKEGEGEPKWQAYRHAATPLYIVSTGYWLGEG